MKVAEESTLSPLRNESKLEFEIGTIASKTEEVGCCCGEQETGNRILLPIKEKKEKNKVETEISGTIGQKCCEEKPVENRILLPTINKRSKEGSINAASRIEGVTCCCEENVIGNEVPIAVISENKNKEGLETMTFKIEGLGCSCEGQIIERKMKLLQGVKAFSLNPITNQIKVTFDPLAVSVPDIEKAVSKAGIKAILIKAK